MNLAEALKLKTAAKAWLGMLAVAAQVALTYLPDHNTGYYTAVQALVGFLSIIGIYAVPNKVTETKTVTDDILAQFNAIIAQFKDSLAVVTPLTENAVASVDHQAAYQAAADQAAKQWAATTGTKPEAPVLIPAPFTLPTTVETTPEPAHTLAPQDTGIANHVSTPLVPAAVPDLGPDVATPDVPVVPAAPVPTQAP